MSNLSHKLEAIYRTTKHSQKLFLSGTVGNLNYEYIVEKLPSEKDFIAACRRTIKDSVVLSFVVQYLQS